VSVIEGEGKPMQSSEEITWHNTNLLKTSNKA